MSHSVTPVAPQKLQESNHQELVDDEEPTFLLPMIDENISAHDPFYSSYTNASVVECVQNAVSFSSYSTVSQDGDVHDFSEDVICNLNLNSSSSSTEIEDPIGLSVEESKHRRRSNSDVTQGTTQMYDKSAALAQQAREEVIHALDLANNATCEMVRPKFKHLVLSYFNELHMMSDFTVKIRLSILEIGHRAL